MNEVKEQEILDALRKVQDPDLRKDLVTLGFIKDLKVEGTHVSYTIELTTPACPVRDQLKDESIKYVSEIPGVETVDVNMTSRVRKGVIEHGKQMIPNVKNVIPVASGKGGVGKSTISANLALALAGTGAKVGLMDADIYGPSIPMIMGITDPIEADENRFIPAYQYGIKVISAASMIPAGKAAIMRGPILHKLIEQFLGRTEWGELDYLVIDLPPGTGDIHLSICQMIPLTGAVIVSTPQDMALRIAEKAIFMFQQLRTPILGLIENMSYFTCNHGERYEIFGHGGAMNYCMENQIPFLGEIPLSTKIRELSDTGQPVVYSDPGCEQAKDFVRAAEMLAAQISVQAIRVEQVEEKETTPEKIEHSKREILILWKDGLETRYPAYDLRCRCGCALCVDERTGYKIIQNEMTDKDVEVLSITPVGNYGIQIQWSDNHSTGIYTFEDLRKTLHSFRVDRSHPRPVSHQ